MKKQNESRTQVRDAFLEAADNQIREGNPPETKQTLERLIAEGYSNEEARKLIAVVIGVEISNMLRQQKPFNNTRFVAALNQLPDLPEDEKGNLG